MTIAEVAALDRKNRDRYRPVILKNASRLKKDIYELMEGCGCWESTAACAAIEQLVDDGLLTEVEQRGPFFQHKYFVKTTGEQHEQ